MAVHIDEEALQSSLQRLREAALEPDVVRICGSAGQRPYRVPQRRTVRPRRDHASPAATGRIGEPQPGDVDSQVPRAARIPGWLALRSARLPW